MIYQNCEKRIKKAPIKGIKSGQMPHRLRLPLREERSGKITKRQLSYHASSDWLSFAKFQFFQPFL